MANRPTKDAYAAARLDYVAGKGSLAIIAEAHGIPLRSLERHCAKEGWRRLAEGVGGNVAVGVAAELVKQRAGELALTSTALIERQISVSDKLIGQIESKLDKGDVPIQQLKALAAAWRDVIKVGRDAFGLDQERPQNRSVIAIFQGALPPMQSQSDSSAFMDVESEPVPVEEIG